MSPPKTNAQRQQAHRDRAKTGEAIPQCSCGKRLQGNLSRVRGICSACWKLTDQGKAETAENVRKCRERKRKKGEES
jgi:hypothetical protein